MARAHLDGFGLTDTMRASLRLQIVLSVGGVGGWMKVGWLRGCVVKGCDEGGLKRWSGVVYQRRDGACAVTVLYLRVPIAVIDNNHICCCQCNPHPSCSGGQEHGEEAPTGILKTINSGLTLTTCHVVIMGCGGKGDLCSYVSVRRCANRCIIVVKIRVVRESRRVGRVDT